MSRSRAIWNIVIGLVVLAGVAWCCQLVFGSVRGDWTRPWEYRGLLWKGWVATVWVSLGALAGSLLVGTLLWLGQRSGFPALKWPCRLFLEFVRETPLLVQLIVGYFGIFAPLLSRTLDGWGWNDKLVIGVILLSLFEGAYLGEILRGGVDSIPRTQWDSARAVGFTPFQVHRHVIFPQALRRVLPAVAGQCVSLVKDSSLLCVIGVQEFAYQARAYSTMTASGMEGYLPLALGYLVLTAPIAFLSHRLERRYRDET